MSKCYWHVFFLHLALLYGSIIIPNPKKYALQKRITHYIHSIETKGQHKTSKYQKKILSSLKSKSDFNPTQDLLVSTIALFSLGATYPTVINNQIVLENSVHYFWGTPGYIGTLMAFLRHANEPASKGRLYEIQCAVALHQCQKKKDMFKRAHCHYIQAFNTQRVAQKKSGELLSREFDIITNDCWIECKDRNFEQIVLESTKSTPICTQLLDQKEIVDVHNKTHRTSVTFQLYSKQVLPYTWKEWLNIHHIPFCEGY